MTRRIAQTRQLPVSELSFFPGNPRRGDVAAIRESLQATGQYRALVVRSDTLQVLAGNHTLAAMRELGFQKALCHLVDVDDESARRIVLADNRTAELASYDDEALAGLLSEMDDLTGTGWEQGAVDELLATLSEDAGRDTEPAEPPKVPRTKPGDLYLLGEHRLLCGDSTVDTDVLRLMGGEKADATVTDPPYCSGGFQESGRAAGSVGTTAVHKQVANDRLSTRGYMALLKATLAAVPTPYLYIFTDWRMWVYLFDVVESSGFGVRSMIVWDKGTPGMGRGWRSQHELIMWGAKQTPPFDKHAAAVGNVLTESGTGNLLHTTQKPVALVEALLNNSSFIATVSDPFAGSGSTLIACENLSRRCYAMELDAGYVDVCVDRWERHTGRSATRELAGDREPLSGKARRA